MASLYESDEETTLDEVESSQWSDHDLDEDASESELDEAMEYGRLAFDHFALQRWDFSKPESKDRQQWEELARTYRALTPKQRMPWHTLEGVYPSATACQFSRVLTAHQTPQERALSVSPNLSDPIWLRTCYLPELEDAYNHLKENVLNYKWGSPIVEKEMILDDPSLYNFGSDWARILDRIPMLTDKVKGNFEEMYDDAGLELTEDEYQDAPAEERDILQRSARTVVLVFVVDEEALRDEIVKTKWLDSHGECMMQDRWAADGEDLSEKRGLLLNAWGLSDFYLDS